MERDGIGGVACGDMHAVSLVMDRRSWNAARTASYSLNARRIGGT